MPLEPHVGDAPSVPSQVVETEEPVEVLDGDGADRFRLRQPQVDGDAAAALVRGQRAPVGDAPAVLAKMKAERAASPGIDAGRPCGPYAFAFIVVGP